MNQAQLERLKRIVAEGRGIWVGIQDGTLDGQRLYDDLVLFNNLRGDTLALKANDLTVARVRVKLYEKEREYERAEADRFQD